MLVFYPVNLDLVINELVHVGDHGAALDVHQDEAGDDLGLKRRVSSCRRARVNIKLVLMLICLKLVCVPGDQDVTVQLSVNINKEAHSVTLYNSTLVLPINERQGLLISPGDDLVPVTDTDPELTNRDHLLLGVVEVLVELPPDHVHVTGQGLEVVQGLLGAEVPRAEDVLNSPRDK